MSDPKMTDLEAKFLFLTRVYGLPAPVQQYRFCADHPRMLMDFAWPDKRIGIDVDGEMHHRGWAKMAADRRKDNVALDMGWKLYRYTSMMLRDETVACMEQVKRALGEGDNGDQPDRPCCC